MGRQPQLARIQSADAALNRVQDQLHAALAPVLRNPVNALSDWRITEGAYPDADGTCLLVQHRSGATWATALALDSHGARLPSAFAQSSSCGEVALNTVSASLADLTNLNVTLTTTGRPVVVACVPDDDGSGAHAGFFLSASVATGAISGAADLALAISGDVSALKYVARLSFDMTTSSGVDDFASSWSPSEFSYLYHPPAGTYTFTAQAKLAAGDEFDVNNLRLTAFEV